MSTENSINLPSSEAIEVYDLELEEDAVRTSSVSHFLIDISKDHPGIVDDPYPVLNKLLSSAYPSSPNLSDAERSAEIDTNFRNIVDPAMHTLPALLKVELADNATWTYFEYGKMFTEGIVASKVINILNTFEGEYHRALITIANDQLKEGGAKTPIEAFNYIRRLRGKNSEALINLEKILPNFRILGKITGAILEKVEVSKVSEG